MGDSVTAMSVIGIAIAGASILNLLSGIGLIVVGFRRVRQDTRVPIGAAAVLAYLYVAQCGAFAITLLSGVQSHGMELSRLDDWLFGLNLTLLLFPALPFELAYLILYHWDRLGSKAYWILMSLCLSLHAIMAITTFVGIARH